MTRKKKILIGAGVVIILGAIAFANIKFKRTEGTAVNAEALKRRTLLAIVSASGKIQPKRSVNISADTMGRDMLERVHSRRGTPAGGGVVRGEASGEGRVGGGAVGVFDEGVRVLKRTVISDSKRSSTSLRNTFSSYLLS